MRFVLFQAASFLSAFLLFGVQPYVAKTLLPAFGGSVIVWGTCMVSFQGLLFAGYLLSHAILRRFDVRQYGWCHIILLASALAFFRPLEIPGKVVAGNPLVPILGYLGNHIAFPFLLLTFSTPLLQRWLAQSGLPQSADPYRLFSPSNLGSLLALLAYPVLIEPSFDLAAQGKAFWIGLALMTGLYLILQMISKPAFAPEFELQAAELSPTKQGDENRSVWRRRYWAIGFLTAGSSALLLSITNAVSFSLSSAPLLWILPLSLYLLTFILCFKKNPWTISIPERWAPWWTALGLTLFLMFRLQFAIGTFGSALCHYGFLFAGCLGAHALTAKLKPSDIRELTWYYTVISAGGFVGSLMVSWIIPVVSREFVEYPLAMALILIGMALYSREKCSWPRSLPLSIVIATGSLFLLSWCLRGGSTYGFLAIVALVFFFCLFRRTAPWLVGIATSLALITGFVKTILVTSHNSRHWRNYYGMYEVYDVQGRRYLLHGPTQHGYQYLSGIKQQIPLSYYHPTAPAGDLLKPKRQNQKTRHLGMIGLGTGALTAYARPAERFDIFELDPLNVKIAESEFSYLRLARQRGVTVNIEIGDGRLLLKKVPDNQFDYLILDAFTGGAIPTHLLTLEALRLYERVVKPDGVVLMHISSRMLNLGPLLTRAVRSLGHELLFQASYDSPDGDVTASLWAAFSPDPQQEQSIRAQGWFSEPRPSDQLPRPWTDQFSNLLSVMLAEDIEVLENGPKR